ncbi:E3 ubiquitin-protein ligase RNF181 [Halyomorpha halys]|uniref:E3 ubiquitin-protein ligase RNF181 n=1 Tax=Halyomorpha halys TaxID=286706 RepID=UPI0006D4D98A|nr:E3 ubiquitin-protein ligase RNF181-like [Halyomorpha halys]
MADYFDEMGWKPLGEGETPNQLLHIARLFRDFGMFEELGEHLKLPPPTSRKIIETLPNSVINRRDAQCPVCLKQFDQEEEAKLLPCKHEFHSPCIIPWLEKTSTCPLCRHELPTDDETHEEYKQQKKREKAREEEIDNLHNSMFS